MALTQVTGPYPIFTDLDGTPLDDGYLYIGEVNQDPEQNPIQVYWDSNLTIAATQPIRTSNGYAYRNGTPALLYTGGEFSITIRNKREEFVLYSPVGYGFDPAAVSASVVKNDFTGDGVTVNFTLSAAPSTILATNVFINGVYQEKDSYSLLGNVITFSIAPPLSSSIEVMTNETGVINSGNATAISYTAGYPGATAQTVQTKLEQYVSVKDFGAVGDGVTDDTAAFHAARDGAGTGQDIYVNPGIYIVDTCTLNVANQKWVLATGAEIRSVDGVTTDAFVITADNVSITGSGVFYNGGLAAGTTYHCIKIDGADNVVLDGISIGGAKGPCVGVFDANNTIIRNVYFYDTWYAAVYAQPVTKNMIGITIASCVVSNTTSVGTNYRYGFNVHSDAGAVYSIDNVVLTGNRLEYPTSLTQYPLLMEVYGGATTSYKIDNVSVTGNVTSGGGMGCSISGVEVVTVSGNSMSGSYLYGIEIADTKNAVVSANSIRGSQRGIALNNVPSGNISVSGNAITATTGACIYASQVTAFVSISGGSYKPASGTAITILSCKYWSINGGVADGSSGGTKVVLLDKSDQGTITALSAKDFTENAVLFFADTAAAYNRVIVSNCVWDNVVNSLNIITQLSGGASIGSQFSYIGNRSSTDTSYRRDYLDVLNNIIDFIGSGTPEGAYSGGVGSVFRRTNGGAGTTFYIKESGTGNTGWVGK